MQSSICFDDITLDYQETEGIKYIGSKLKIIPHILKLAKQINAKTVVDGFSGSTRVSQSFAQLGYTVVSNDIAVWSEVFGQCYLMNNRGYQEYQDLIDHLNSLTPIDGWFSENYGGIVEKTTSHQPDGLKKPWQLHNTRKLDAIREEIDRLNLSRIDKSVALTSLILALDKVDSTLGHFVSYLSDWSPRSYNNLHLKVPKLVPNNGQHSVLRGDVFDILPLVEVDLAYFDPPYGSNNEKMPPSRVRYTSYYHVWTSICLNDRPSLFGKAKRRVDSSDTVSSSVFEDFRKDENNRYIAVEAIDKLLNLVQAKWVILSYSSGGRATAEDLNLVIGSHGKLLDVVEIDYRKNVMAEMRWKNEWLRDVDSPNREFLFLIEK